MAGKILPTINPFKDQRILACFHRAFDRHLRAGSPTSCWEWGGTLVQGYGIIGARVLNIGHNKITGKHFLAHRVAWFFANGPIPESLCVLHKCDNRKCCNPNHLFIGTMLDNIRDMNNKGRNRHSLTAAQVLNIRQARQRRVPCYKLAKKYGVTTSTIRRISCGKIWKKVGGPITRGYPKGRTFSRSVGSVEMLSEVLGSLDSGMTMQATADKFGIGITTVHSMAHGTHWSCREVA